MQSIKKSRGAILMSNKIDLEQGRGRTLCNDHSLKDVTILYISE